MWLLTEALLLMVTCQANLSTNELPLFKHFMFADVVAVLDLVTNQFIRHRKPTSCKREWVGQGPTDFKYTIRGTNSGANLGKTGATGNGSPHSHNHMV